MVDKEAETTWSEEGTRQDEDSVWLEVEVTAWIGELFDAAELQGLLRTAAEHLPHDGVHDLAHACSNFRTAIEISTRAGLELPPERKRALFKQCLFHDVGYYHMAPGSSDGLHAELGSVALGDIYRKQQLRGNIPWEELHMACMLHGAAGVLHADNHREHKHAVLSQLSALQHRAPEIFTNILLLNLADLINQCGQTGVQRNLLYTEVQESRLSLPHSAKPLFSDSATSYPPDEVYRHEYAAVDDLLYWNRRPMQTLQSDAVIAALVGNNPEFTPTWQRIIAAAQATAQEKHREGIEAIRDWAMANSRKGQEFVDDYLASHG